LGAVLLDQFPTRTDLAIQLNNVLGEKLDAVAGGSSLTVPAFNLIQWIAVDQ
jgi:hypothetical protein